MDKGGGPSNSANFNAYNTRLQGAALAATRKAAALPSDITFHRSMDPELAQGLDTFSERVLSVTNRLLSLVSTVDPQAKGKGKAKLETQDDVVDNFHSFVVDAMDQLLERTDICLDNVLGKNKAPAIAINPPLAQPSKASKKDTGPKGRSEPVIQHAAHLRKPQVSFKKPPDNSDAPWHPTLSHKYNAKVPLGHIYNDPDTESTSIVSNHPYRYEITHLSYPPRMFKPCIPIQPTSLEETHSTWVATVADLQLMLSKLKTASEIAVDLEHHSYRSYSGFLCLMQISDRENDWVVDLLAVRDEVESLNEVFTDPVIVKVFHGAESDIVWLQQDFSLYIVNLFDTFHASKLLEFPRHGLANLLEMYCDFIPDKRYQLADWRIRPLPTEMLLYARSDTHFLLYIYDNLRNALLDRSKSKAVSKSNSARSSPTSSPPPSSSRVPTTLLDEALSRSAETSLRVYSKEPYDPDEGSGPGGWDTLAKRWNKTVLTTGGPGVGIGAMQREVYKSVHWWRERVAREEDESTRYVLPNHALFVIAEQPPAEIAALLILFKPSVPPVVKRRAKELLTVIKEAVKRGLQTSRTVGQPEQTPAPEVLAQAQKAEEPKDAVMAEPEVRVSDKVVLDIWGGKGNQPSSSSSTSHSSLFRPSKSNKSSATLTTLSFSTDMSSLFGAKAQSQAQTSKSSKLSSHIEPPHFQDLVAKIHRSLIMAPTLPQIPAPSTGTSANSEPKLETDAASGMQIEIPYVPASQRPTKQTEPLRQEEPDTIVVVGQARQKRKRKAGAGKANASKAVEKAKAEDQQQAAEEPFDFSAVPNILDDNPDAGDGAEDNKKRKRQRKQGGKGGNFYGDFPAPPKAHSELKSGNQSITFK